MSLRGNSINRAAKLETSKYFKSQKYVKAFPSYHSDVSPLKPFFFFGSRSGNKLHYRCYGKMHRKMYEDLLLRVLWSLCKQNNSTQTFGLKKNKENYEFPGEYRVCVSYLRKGTPFCCYPGVAVISINRAKSKQKMLVHYIMSQIIPHMVLIKTKHRLHLYLLLFSLPSLANMQFAWVFLGF